MRAWLSVLVFILGATGARAQNVYPVEPFVLTTPDYPVFGQSTVNCDKTPYPPNRSGRRGSNPYLAAEEQRLNPACPQR
jgi:hypothetical protein